MSDTGIATDVIQEDVSDDQKDLESLTETRPDAASLLRELEHLRAEKLVTDAEYEQKRSAVLARFD